MLDIKTTLLRLQDLVFNVQSHFDKELIISLYDSLNAFNLDYQNKLALSSSLMFLIEKVAIKDYDFCKKIISSYIGKNLDINYFMNYLKIRNFDEKSTKQDYKNFLNEILKDKIIFLNEFQKCALNNAVTNMCVVVKDNDLTMKIQDFINKIPFFKETKALNDNINNFEKIDISKKIMAEAIIDFDKRLQELEKKNGVE